LERLHPRQRPSAGRRLFKGYPKCQESLWTAFLWGV